MKTFDQQALFTPLMFAVVLIMAGLIMALRLLDPYMVFFGKVYCRVLGHKDLRRQHDLQYKETKKFSFCGHGAIKGEVL